MKKLFISLTLMSALVIGACSGGGTGNNAATPIKSSDPCISATSKWALWTSGTCLRGANTAQWVMNPDPAIDAWWQVSARVVPPYVQADFNNLAALGANVVNISGPGLWTQTPPYQLDPEVQANLDNLLDMIQKANMFAVITVRMGPGRQEHWMSPTQPPAVWGWSDHSCVVWNDATAQQAWVDMWAYMANRYKSRPIVVGYDLMVEPNANESEFQPNGLDMPDMFYPKYANTLLDWNPMAKKITDAIRQVDKDTPILIGGMGFSATTWISSITSNGDSKTVYMAHQYEPAVTYTHQIAPYTNTYGTTSGTYTRDYMVKVVGNLTSFRSTRGAPVGVNEFGVQRYQPGADQYLNDVMDLFETNGINYSVWLWETSYSLINYFDFDYRKGQDPKNTKDVSPNTLTTALQNHWKKNTVRPSNRGF